MTTLRHSNMVREVRGRRATFALVAALCAASLFSSGCQHVFRPSVEIKPSDVRQWVACLASDEMRGRANGSEQMKQAAQWIAGQFERFGLHMAPGQRSYLQQYSFTRPNGMAVSERNVVGYIEGADPELRDEYLIISAHFDHLGVRRPVDGDSIYNGADDDASGVAAMIGIARILDEMRASPGRSIVFIAFSGEEIAFNGSRYYRDNPLFPLHATYLNVNLEMVGQCAKIGRRRYYITGASHTNIDELVNQYNSTGDWQIDATVEGAERYFLMADNRSFAVIKREQNMSYGVPAHTFLFYDGEPHRHMPYDEVDMLDYENLASFVNYMAGLVLHLADLQEDVVWTDERYRHIGEYAGEPL